MSGIYSRFAISFAGALALTFATAQADPDDYPYDGIVEVDTELGFDALYDSVISAVSAHDMIVIARPSASRAAAQRGVEIPGNAVVELYRNDFAVRMLEASVPAGIEAPLRLYLTENEDGTSRLTYRQPTAVFAPYDDADLDLMAAELDEVVEAIVATAIEMP